MLFIDKITTPLLALARLVCQDKAYQACTSGEYRGWSLPQQTARRNSLFCLAKCMLIDVSHTGGSLNSGSCAVAGTEFAKIESFDTLIERCPFFCILPAAFHAVEPGPLKMTRIRCPLARCRTIKCSGSWRMAMLVPCVSLISTLRPSRVLASCPWVDAGFRSKSKMYAAATSPMLPTRCPSSVNFLPGTIAPNRLTLHRDRRDSGDLLPNQPPDSHRCLRRIACIWFKTQWRIASRRRWRVVSVAVKADYSHIFSATLIILYLESTKYSLIAGKPKLDSKRVLIPLEADPPPRPATRAVVRAYRKLNASCAKLRGDQVPKSPILVRFAIPVVVHP